MLRAWRQSRWIAGGGLGVFFLGAVVLPWLHLAHHHNDHRHGILPGTIEWKAIADPRTGRVDLNRLATALGYQNKAHEAAHRAGIPHSHPGDAPGTPSHGEGSLEHFGAAVLVASASLVVLVSASPPLPLPVLPEVEAPTLSSQLVCVQRAQAPPIAAVG